MVGSALLTEFTIYLELQNQNLEVDKPNMEKRRQKNSTVKNNRKNDFTDVCENFLETNRGDTCPFFLQ